MEGFNTPLETKVCSVKSFSKNSYHIETSHLTCKANQILKESISEQAINVIFSNAYLKRSLKDNLTKSNVSTNLKICDIIDITPH